MSSFMSIGDLARGFQTSLQTTRVKGDLQRLTQELSSGRRSDLSTTVSRDYLPLAGIERSLSAISAYETAAAEATAYASTMQAALAKIADHRDQLGPALLTAGNSLNKMMIDTAASDAMTRLDAVVDAINIRVADRTAFAGTAINRPALVDARTIINDLNATTAGLTDAASIEAAVIQWFDQPGGGYETVAFTGSTTPLSEFRVADGESVSLSISALDQEFRDVLKGFSLAALVGAGALSGDISERAALTKRAGEIVVASSDGLTRMQSKIGIAEARIDHTASSTSAMKHALEIARLEIIQADPYETATALEQTRAQLENIFVVTSRLSRLTLTEYLR